jgi:hypothetical protein
MSAAHLVDHTPVTETDHRRVTLGAPAACEAGARRGRAPRRLSDPDERDDRDDRDDRVDEATGEDRLTVQETPLLSRVLVTV